MKISVIIVTLNRKNDLITTLEGFYKQTYKNFEIIIIDNASTDGTRQMIENDYPDVKYLWLPDNFDIKSINIGIEMSDGDIIWRTDSDSHPETEHEFQRVVDIFTKNPDIDIISMEDVEVRKNYEIWDWYPYKVDKTNVPERGYKAHIFPGTGAAIRRKVYNKIGGFWEFGFEEIDFCTRAIVAGFTIRYFPNVRVYHYATPNERNSDERWIRISKQFIRYNAKYFPFWKAMGRITVVFFSQILAGVISRVSFMAWIEGILTMQTTVISTFRKERVPVKPELVSEITLGVSLTKVQIKFFRDVIINKVKRWLKK